MIDLKPFLGEFITGVLALFFGWLAKGKAQKRAANADVLDKVQGIYDKMVRDTNVRMDELKAEIDDLKKKQTHIDAEWRKKVQEVERKWQTKYSRLQAKYNDLLKKLNEYKEQDDKD